MSNHYRWTAVVGALLLAAMVGFAAYQAGVERGIEQSGKIVVAPPSGTNPNPYPYPYPYPYYGWHRPWGFGGFFFFPLFFLFWFLAGRGLFWRRAGWYGGGCGPRHDFDEWHRQAHERDAGGTSSGGSGER
ncbi:MAG TPA: hypothetical protein VH394_12565 [Thermoanaerobaculia bacterium]|jgi:hypothetical protein|nr:hypothetical protein [Thermoanaerobaculia bacterium]